MSKRSKRVPNHPSGTDATSSAGTAHRATDGGGEFRCRISLPDGTSYEWDMHQALVTFIDAFESRESNRAALIGLNGAPIKSAQRPRNAIIVELPQGRARDVFLTALDSAYKAQVPNPTTDTAPQA